MNCISQQLFICNTEISKTPKNKSFYKVSETNKLELIGGCSVFNLFHLQCTFLRFCKEILISSTVNTERYPNPIKNVS